AQGNPSGPAVQLFAQLTDVVKGDVAALADGSFIVTAANVQFDPTHQDVPQEVVYQQRVSASGEVIGGPEVVVSNGINGNFASTVPARVLALPDGGYDITYAETYRPTPFSSVDLAVQRYDASGTK